MENTIGVYRAKLVLDFDSDESAEKYYEGIVKEFFKEDILRDEALTIDLCRERVVIRGGSTFVRSTKCLDLIKQTRIEM